MDENKEDYYEKRMQEVVSIDEFVRRCVIKENEGWDSEFMEKKVREKLEGQKTIIVEDGVKLMTVILMEKHNKDQEARYDPKEGAMLIKKSTGRRIM